jgi:group I intron endonuclease
MGYIYLITNTENNMKYVGQSKCGDIETRWNTHRKMLKDSIGNYLLNAYKKYGIDKFKFQIICICFDEDCDIYEEQYIKKYNSIAPNGYNLKLGGKSSKHHESTKELIRSKLKERITDEIRAEMRERVKNNPYFNYGKKLTDEQKKTISDRQKLYWSKVTEEQKDIIYNRKRSNTKKIQITNSNLKINDICNIENQLNNINNSLAVINKTIITLNNMSPPKLKINSSDTKLEGLRMGSESRKKAVGKFDTMGNMIEKFSSIIDASNKTHICRFTISKVCLNKPRYKTAGGFIWKFI